MENQIEVKTNKGIEYIIRRKNGFEYIFSDGKLIIYEPFYFVARETTPINGQDYILVHKLNNKMNYVSFDGEFLLADDYTEIDPYAKNNLIRVYERGLMNFAKTTDGELLFDKWFRKIEYIYNYEAEKMFDCYYQVQRMNGKWNIADTSNGKFVLPKWLDEKPTDRFCNLFLMIEELENSVKERKLTARAAEIKLLKKYDMDDLEDVLPHRRIEVTDFNHEYFYMENGEVVWGEFPRKWKIHDNVEYCQDTQRFEFIEYFVKDEDEE